MYSEGASSVDEGELGISSLHSLTVCLETVCTSFFHGEVSLLLLDGNGTSKCKGTISWSASVMSAAYLTNITLLSGSKSTSYATLCHNTDA